MERWEGRAGPGGTWKPPRTSVSYRGEPEPASSRPLFPRSTFPSQQQRSRVHQLPPRWEPHGRAAGDTARGAARPRPLTQRQPLIPAKGAGAVSSRPRSNAACTAPAAPAHSPAAGATHGRRSPRARSGGGRAPPAGGRARGSARRGGGAHPPPARAPAPPPAPPRPRVPGLGRPLPARPRRLLCSRSPRPRLPQPRLVPSARVVPPAPVQDAGNKGLEPSRGRAPAARG